MPFSELIRLVVLVGLIAAATLAVGSWALTAHHLSPFGKLGRMVRRLSDPVIEPIERFVLGRGGNPRNAPWWLLGMAIVGGIVLLTVAQWLVAAVDSARLAAGAGPRGVVRLLITLAGRVLGLALIVRVIGSWFGAGRFRPWMRPFYALTDWLVEPLRKVIPPIGIIDITPLVGWVLVEVAVAILLRVV